jgi:hypothetical protein
VSWNVRTLLDNTRVDRQQRTAIMAKELALYRIGVVGHSKIHVQQRPTHGK